MVGELRKFKGAKIRTEFAHGVDGVFSDRNVRDIGSSVLLGRRVPSLGLGGSGSLVWVVVILGSAPWVVGGFGGGLVGGLMVVLAPRWLAPLLVGGLTPLLLGWLMGRLMGRLVGRLMGGLVAVLAPRGLAPLLLRGLSPLLLGGLSPLSGLSSNGNEGDSGDEGVHLFFINCKILCCLLGNSK